MNSYESQQLVIETADASDMENANVVIATESIILSGATGAHYAKMINGVYEPMVDLSDGASVYRKVCDNNCRIVYNGTTSQWQIRTHVDDAKPSPSQPPQSTPLATCTVPTKCTLDALTHTPAPWSIKTHPNSAPVPCPTIRLTVATAMEVEVARVLVGSNSVALAGATGKAASTLNGVYAPTATLSWGVSVYTAVQSPHANMAYWAPTRYTGRGGPATVIATVPAASPPSQSLLLPLSLSLPLLFPSPSSIIPSSLPSPQTMAHTTRRRPRHRQMPRLLPRHRQVPARERAPSGGVGGVGG